MVGGLLVIKYGLSERPQIVAANKTDIIQDEDAYKAFLEEMKKRGYEVFEISAATKQGVKELIDYTAQLLSYCIHLCRYVPACLQIRGPRLEDTL